MTPRQLAKRLDRLADATEDLFQELAEETLELIDQGFNDAVDPRGVGWAPRRRGSRRTNPLLQDTLTLREGFFISGVNKNGFVILNETPYEGFHQRGTVNLPARRMVPGTGEGLGRWADPLQKIAHDFIKSSLETGHR